MASINWPALLTFLLITALSPGPNNLSCISMGVTHGYPRTLAYIYGIVIGIIAQSLISGFISAALLNAFPLYEAVLRVIGAGYVLWLAYQALRSSAINGGANGSMLGFREGFMLQFLNIKAILFVLTIFTAYLTPVLGSALWIALTAVALGARAFLINSLYALFGAGIRRWLANPIVSQALNIIIALLLVWNALDLLGLPGRLFG